MDIESPAKSNLRSRQCSARVMQRPMSNRVMIKRVRLARRNNYSSGREKYSSLSVFKIQRGNGLDGCAIECSGVNPSHRTKLRVLFNMRMSGEQVSLIGCPGPRRRDQTVVAARRRSIERKYAVGIEALDIQTGDIGNKFIAIIITIPKHKRCWLPGRGNPGYRYPRHPRNESTRILTSISEMPGDYRPA